MLVGYVRSGLARRRAACELFVRRLPPCRSFLLFAGLERVIDYLLALRFTDEDIARIAEDPSSPGRHARVRSYLEGFRFTGDLFAPPEGTPVFPDEPSSRSRRRSRRRARRDLLLSVVNHDTRIASKAARVVLAAGDRPCFEFGARRAHELSAADAARRPTSRASPALERGCGPAPRRPGDRTVAHMWSWPSPRTARRPRSGATSTSSATGRRSSSTPTRASRAWTGDRRSAGARRDPARLGRPRALSSRRGAGSTAPASRGSRSSLGRPERVQDQGLDARGPGSTRSASGPTSSPPGRASLGAVYKLVEVEGKDGRMLPVAKRSAGKRPTRAGR